MSAEEVRRRAFSTAFRGFDQAEVRAYLDRIADELEDAERKEKELRAELREARDRMLHPRLDEDTITSALGEEAARILRSAHEAAADIRRKAEEHAARVLGEAHREAEVIRAQAEGVMGQRAAEAEAAAAEIRAAGESDAAALLSHARQRAEAALVEARARCDALAQEADATRTSVLGELARRRRVMNAQVEQLGAGRETILAALQAVRGLLDQTVDSLDRITTEAKSAADEALHRALAEPEAAPAELEREAGSSMATPLEGLSRVLADLEDSLASIAAGTRLAALPEEAAHETAHEPAPEAVPAGAESPGSGESTGSEAPEAGAESPQGEAGRAGAAHAEAPQAPAPQPASSQAPTPQPAAPQPAAPQPPAPQPPAPQPAAPRAEAPPVAEVAPEPRAPRARPSDVAASTGAPSEAQADEDAEHLTEVERRGSSLRLLRRGRGRSEAEHASAHPPVVDEGIRLIPPTPAPPPPEALAPTPAEADPGRPAEPAPAAAPTSPEGPAPTSPQAPAHAAPEGAGPTSAQAPAHAAPEAPPAAHVPPAPAPPEAAAAEHPDQPGGSAVDELFARLRAERAAAKEKAHAVLAQAWETSEAGAGGEAGAAAAVPDATSDALGPEVAAEREAEGAEDSGPASAGSEDAEGPLIEARNRLLGSVPERMARRLKRTLQDDQNDVLDRVRGMSRGQSGPLLPAEEDHRRTYASAVSPIVEEAFRAGEEYAATYLGGAPVAGATANGHSADALAQEVVGSLRSRLTEVFERPGGEDTELSDGASAVYRAWKGERVESLAMDYVVASFTAGVLASVPEGTSLRWVVDDDGGPCPDCDDNALAGPTPAGESFPTGQKHPPAHPGCRCLLAPASP